MPKSQKLKISKTKKAKNPEIDYSKHASYFLQVHGWRYMKSNLSEYKNGTVITHPLSTPFDFRKRKDLVKFCDKFYGEFWQRYKKKCKALENAGIY